MSLFVAAGWTETEAAGAGAKTAAAAPALTAPRTTAGAAARTLTSDKTWHNVTSSWCIASPGMKTLTSPSCCTAISASRLALMVSPSLVAVMVKAYTAAMTPSGSMMQRPRMSTLTSSSKTP
jgi:hypothetical protein